MAAHSNVTDAVLYGRLPEQEACSKNRRRAFLVFLLKAALVIPEKLLDINLSRENGGFSLSHHPSDLLGNVYEKDSPLTRLHHNSTIKDFSEFTNYSVLKIQTNLYIFGDTYLVQLTCVIYL